MNLDIVRHEADDLITQVNILKVVDQASANRAAELAKLGREAIKKIKHFFEERKKMAHELWKKECRDEQMEIQKVQPAVDYFDGQLIAWRKEQERHRREAEEARRKAEEEKRRLEEEALRKAQEAEDRAEAERKRLEREAERLAQEAARNVEDEAEQRRIEEEREKLRIRAEENARRAKEESDKALNEAAAAEMKLVPPPPQVDVPITRGMAMKTTWHAEVTDLRELLRAILAGAAPITAVEPNMAVLNKMAHVMKDGAQVPGVRFFSKNHMAGLGKRS